MRSHTSAAKQLYYIWNTSFTFDSWDLYICHRLFYKGLFVHLFSCLGTIYGFNVTPSKDIVALSKQNNVSIKSHAVIYNLLDDIKVMYSFFCFLFSTIFLSALWQRHQAPVHSSFVDLSTTINIFVCLSSVFEGLNSSRGRVSFLSTAYTSVRRGESAIVYPIVCCQLCDGNYHNKMHFFVNVSNPNVSTAMVKIYGCFKSEVSNYPLKTLFWRGFGYTLRCIHKNIWKLDLDICFIISIAYFVLSYMCDQKRPIDVFSMWQQ